MAEYQPGVCNIGKNEINKRYRFAVAGFVIAAILSYAILSYNLPRWALLFPFIALLMGFEGFYQGFLKFCAGFASKGIYDFTGSGGSKDKVTNPQFRKQDMAKAMEIHLYAIMSSIIVIILIYFTL